MENWPSGYAREVHDRLDSTHAEALRRAAWDAGPLWLLALEQTAGRGRRGRVWSTGRGNFAASLLITPSGGLEKAAVRSFVAALALRDALVELTGAPGLFTVKWPNDVLLAGRKLAGILLETSGPPLRLAIGFGVNLVHAPEPLELEEVAMTPISLKEGTGLTVTPGALLDRLAPAYSFWEERLAAGGFAAIRAAWLESAAGLGRPVVARMPGRSVSGLFETIDAGGALVLQTARGRVSVSAADVHLAAGDPADPPAPPPPGPDRPPAEPPVPDQPDVPGRPGGPDGPDVPPEEPPVIDPPGQDVPSENPPVYDPPGTDVPTEVPPTVPPEIPPGAPPEIPPQVARASRH
jgi:BirA family transcriptional regulator, biotin operon repressor / biotin---[acetyl-CoA-carboxylase] ligase